MGKNAGWILLCALLAYVMLRYYQTKNPTQTLPKCAVKKGSVAYSGKRKKGKYGIVNKPGVSVYCSMAAPNLPAQVRAYKRGNKSQTAQPGFSASLGNKENMPPNAPTCCNTALES